MVQLSSGFLTTTPIISDSSASTSSASSGLNRASASASASASGARSGSSISLGSIAQSQDDASEQSQAETATESAPLLFSEDLDEESDPDHGAGAAKMPLWAQRMRKSEGDATVEDGGFVPEQTPEQEQEQERQRSGTVEWERLPDPMGGAGQVQYRVYKRRWFGLCQLVLLNVVVSWDWLTFSAVSTSAAEYFNTTEGTINWLSTAFLFAFVVVSPLTIWTLNRGVKPAIITASVLTLVGNWIRYAGSRADGGHFGVVMFGQILIGLAQPFVLAAPTRYSDLWFTEKGRISATAIASLANPFGGALGQLIGPFWATSAPQIPTMVLYTAIISTIATLPSLFVPSAPPTPPTRSSSLPKPPLRTTLRHLTHNPSFYLILIPFATYVAFFNAFSSLINQILYPYGFSETQAGICGALLIFVGLAFAALLSPFLDRKAPKPYLLVIKLFCPLIAASYLAFIFAPPTRSEAAPYVIAAVLGAASFALVPVALEFLVEATYPTSPEVGSTVCWAAGQLLGGVFIIVMNALKEPGGGTGDGRETEGWKPPGSMWKALVFEAVVAVAVLPAPLLLGVKRLGLGGGTEERRRLEVGDGGEGGFLTREET